MGKNINKSEPLRVTVTEDTERFLQALIASGYYSGKPGTVAGAIIEERVREMIQTGFLEKAAAAKSNVEKLIGKKTKDS